MGSGRRLKVLTVLLSAVAVVSVGCHYIDETFAEITRTNDIPYGAAVDENGQLETLHLDLYQPSGDTAPRRPVLIWVHGGGYTTGDKSSMAGLATAFAKRGYVSASISYRLRADADQHIYDAIKAAQHDAQAAVRWFRANAGHYRIDSERIAIGGSSAGAITALQVAYRSDDPGDSGNPGYPSHVAAAISISGFAVDLDEIGPGDAPVVYFHSTRDPGRTRFESARNSCDIALDRGLVCEFHPFDGSAHGLQLVQQHQDEIIGATARFLFRYLDLDA
ncbi:MAG: alpha/beta hydrolase [Acidimicrobiia bacterium]